MIPWARLIPWAGYGVAALLFWLWLGLKEDLARQVELCNQDKLRSVAEAENIAREALQEAHRREIAERDSIIAGQRKALALAATGATEATTKAEQAQATAERLIREAREAENATIVQTCVVTPVPDDLVTSISLQ